MSNSKVNFKLIPLSSVNKFCVETKTTSGHIRWPKYEIISFAECPSEISLARTKATVSTFDHAHKKGQSLRCQKAVVIVYY